MPLSGKTAVITGAASGLGLALAGELHRRGARLYLVDRDPAVRRAASGFAGAVALRGDISRPQTWSRLAEMLKTRGVVPEILINNAGVCPGGPFLKLKPAVWKNAFAVNFGGALLGIRALLPAMLRQGQGAVVNIASVAGLLPFPFMGPYGASKAALVSMSLSLGMEMAGSGIRVLTVCPGAVATGILDRSRIDLPAGAQNIIRRAIGVCAASPERTARQIVDAIESGKTLLIPAGVMQPLTLLMRFLPRWYLKVFTALTRLSAR